MVPSVKRSLAIGAAIVGGALGVATLAWLGWAWYESRLPETYSVMDYAIPDDGGAPAGAEGAAPPPPGRGCNQKAICKTECESTL